MKIKVKNNKEFKDTVKKLRAEGYFIITFAKRFAELEKEAKLVVIEY